MQNSNMPSKTKAIEKCKKDKRLLRKKLEEQEEKYIEDEEVEEDEEDDDEEEELEESEEETQSQRNIPQSSSSPRTATSSEFTDSSQPSPNARVSTESSEMIVQDVADSNSKQVDKENNAPTFYIGQDQIEQQPGVKSSSSSSSESSESSSDEDLEIGDKDLEIGDEDIMGFVGGDFEDDEFYDLGDSDDDDDDDEFDIETQIDMESQKMRAKNEEMKFKAMMERSLPSPFASQASIISEMYKMNWFNQVNRKYLTNLKRQKAKEPSEKKLFFDETVTVKTFKKQQQPSEVPIKIQKSEGLNSNQKNPTQRLLAQQRLWHQLKNNSNAHAMFDQHIKVSVKMHNNENQPKFPINLAPLNRNLSDQFRKPNMLLRSRLKPVQKPAEVIPASTKEVVENNNTDLVSAKQTIPGNKGQDFMSVEGRNKILATGGVENDTLNPMYQEKKQINDLIEKANIEIPQASSDRNQFSIEDEGCKVGHQPFKSNIVDNVLVDF